MITEILSQFFAYLNTITHNNQMAAGAITISISYFCRGVPLSIWLMIRRRLVISLSVDNDSDFENTLPFKALMDGLKKFGTATGSRDFKLKGDFATAGYQMFFRLFPGYGKHWFMYNGRPWWYVFQTTDSSGSEKQKSRITLYTIAFTRKPLEDFLTQIHQKRDDEGKVTFWTKSGEDYDLIAKQEIPTIDDIALDNNVRESLRGIVENFQGDGERCKRLGIPHKLVILLHGEPGNGKSTLIPIIAKMLNRNVLINDMRDFEDNMQLISTFQDTNQIQVFEDIHSNEAVLKGSSVSHEDKGVSLEGMLNALNGMVALDGAVVVMTTNYIERLDDAIFRPGRIDHIIELPRIQPEALNEYLEKKAPGMLEYARCTKAVRGCDVAQIMTYSKGEPERFADIIGYVESEIPEVPEKKCRGTNVMHFGD